MKNSELYIITFIVTCFWDIILRILSVNYDKIPNFLKYDFDIRVSINEEIPELNDIEEKLKQI